MTCTSWLFKPVAAVRFGPVMRHIRPFPEHDAFCVQAEVWADSVGFTTATVRNFPSAVNAALTSTGYVGLPALTFGWSAPTGYKGAGTGESPQPERPPFRSGPGRA